MHTRLASALLGATLLGLSAGALADPALGRVENIYVSMSQYILIEKTADMRAHDRPLVADVRLKDADGKPGRRVFVRLDKEAVDAGDVVAINEGDKPGAPRTGPLRARDRLSHIEAKHDTAYARNFFRPATPDFLALRKDD